MMLQGVHIAEVNQAYTIRDTDQTDYFGCGGATNAREHGKRSRWIMGYFILGMVVGSLGTVIVLLLAGGNKE